MTFLLVLLVVLVAVAFASNSAADDICGRVYDGLESGQFDLRVQSSTNTMAANWVGFENVLQYEWAIVSSKHAASLPHGCGTFRKDPDVMPWSSTGSNLLATSLTNSLELSVGETYYVLLRVTFRSGRRMVAATDGVTIKERIEQPLDMPSPSITETSSTRHRRSGFNLNANLPSYECTIDVENHCRNSHVSVGDVLHERYGEPEYNLKSPANLLLSYGSLADRARAGDFVHNPATRALRRDLENIGLVVHTEELDQALALVGHEFRYTTDPNSLGTGNAPPWVLAPIIGGLLAGCCLLLIVVAVLRLIMGGLPERNGEGGDDGDSRGFLGFAFGDSAKEGKGYAGRQKIGGADTSDRTQIAFPDMKIDRLSITHQATDPDAAAASDSKTQRKHPIMNSASSSFRDYRQNA